MRADRTERRWAVARHHRWLKEADIPSADRFRFEREVLSCVLQCAIEYHQLQVGNLASMEVATRHLQLIEQAHRDSPTSPSYDAAEHYLGLVERRGGRFWCRLSISTSRPV